MAHGFSEVENIKVVILYPKNRVSKLQEEQLTRVASNIYPIEIEGSFDDCQALVKEALVDSSLNKINLGSANSINIGRLLPQIIYYVYAYSQIKKNEKNIRFVVPSGNLGNLTAGLFASKMGLPINFLAAINANETLLRYSDSGKYEPLETKITFSNAMDVSNPSNFERIMDLVKNDVSEFRKKLNVYSVDDIMTVETIKSVYEEYDYLLDPHTAVGYKALVENDSEKFNNILISTASPVKFAREIEDKTGIIISDKDQIKKLSKLVKRKTKMQNDYMSFKQYLVTNS
ncbi:MAG: threonine synthase [Candidatus Dojkabacteria bacterium]|nr:threonine synthase [Candidatus Dojkabacteria bacterium]